MLTLVATAVVKDFKLMIQSWKDGEVNTLPVVQLVADGMLLEH